LTKVLGFWEIKKYFYSFKLETNYDQLFHKQNALGLPSRACDFQQGKLKVAGFEAMGKLGKRSSRNV
jgi:hypothetical protein